MTLLFMLLSFFSFFAHSMEYLQTDTLNTIESAFEEIKGSLNGSNLFITSCSNHKEKLLSTHKYIENKTLLEEKFWQLESEYITLDSKSDRYKTNLSLFQIKVNSLSQEITQNKNALSLHSSYVDNSLKIDDNTN